MDIHTKGLDDSTKVQLIVLELDKINEALIKILGRSEDLAARIRNIEDQKLPQELFIITADIKDLKKKFLELNFTLEKKNETIAKIAKINKNAPK